MASDITAPDKTREKVHLKPNHHLVDWVRLNSSMPPPVKSSRKITQHELALHHTKSDCWTVYNGKVYNVTNYIDYHPGGVAKLMLGAGQDCTQLFNKYHRWVNGHAMLSNCCIGTYAGNEVTEGTIQEGDEKEEGNVVNHKKIVDSTDISENGVSLNPEILNKAISNLEMSDDEGESKAVK